MPHFIDGPGFDLALRITLVVLLIATAALSVRLALAEARLAAAGRENVEIALERDGVLIELVRSHSVVAQMERDAAEEQLRAASSAAGLRLVEASTEVERFEAAAEAHEARMQALLAADPKAVESRIEAASRMINDALQARRT
jgi:hypothetical protein